VIRNLAMSVSNFRSTMALDAYLRAENVVGIAEIDTRRLTRILREKGAQSGCIMAGKVDEGVALAAARAFAGLAGMDLAQVVSTTTPYKFDETEWRLGRGFGKLANPAFRVVAYDYGVKRNILRLLAGMGADIYESLVAAVVAAMAIALTAKEEVVRGILIPGTTGNARTLEERCAFEPSSHEDIRWVFATAIGEVFVGTTSGVERWQIGADGTPIPMLVTRASNCADAVGPNLLGASLVVLDRNDRPLRIPLYDGGVDVFEIPESTDFGSPSLRGLMPVREGLLGHADNRIILRGHAGDIVGMDLITGELNFAFALPAEPGVFVCNGLGGRQVTGAGAGTFRVDFPYVVQPLSARQGLRMTGEPFEVRCQSQRADRAIVVDGWLLLSSSQGTAAVSMPVAPPAATPAAAPEPAAPTPTAPSANGNAR
jgi:carbamoyl-phosphate synthase small subunit